MKYDLNKWYKSINRYDGETVYLCVFGLDKKTVYFHFIMLRDNMGDADVPLMETRFMSRKEFKDWYDHPDMSETIVDEKFILKELFDL